MKQFTVTPENEFRYVCSYDESKIELVRELSIAGWLYERIGLIIMGMCTFLIGWQPGLLVLLLFVLQMAFKKKLQHKTILEEDYILQTKSLFGWQFSKKEKPIEVIIIEEFKPRRKGPKVQLLAKYGRSYMDFVKILVYRDNAANDKSIYPLVDFLAERFEIQHMKNGNRK